MLAFHVQITPPFKLWFFSFILYSQGSFLLLVFYPIWLSILQKILRFRLLCSCPFSKIYLKQFQIGHCRFMHWCLSCPLYSMTRLSILIPLEKCKCPEFSLCWKCWSFSIILSFSLSFLHFILFHIGDKKWWQQILILSYLQKSVIVKLLLTGNRSSLWLWKHKRDHKGIKLVLCNLVECWRKFWCSFDVWLLWFWIMSIYNDSVILTLMMLFWFLKLYQLYYIGKMIFIYLLFGIRGE